MPVSPEYPAAYTDGRTSALHPVAIRITGSRLVLNPADDEHRVLAEAALKNCYVLEDRTEGTPGVFSFRDAPDARLYVYDKILYGKIRARLLQEHRSAYRIAFGPAGLAVCVLLCAAFIYLMVPVFQAGTGLLARFVPTSVEERLGAVALRQFTAGDKICEAPEAGQALAKLARHLADAGNLPVEPRILILDNRVPNAFALPGNTLLVNSGLLHIARAEEDVAGVLSHEMGHIAHRHALAGFLQSLGLQTVMTLIFGDSSLAALPGVALSLHYSRRMETQADETGARMMLAAGYDPAVLGEFIAYMEEAERTRLGSPTDEKGSREGQAFDQVLSYFSSHPRTAARITHTASLSRETPSEDFRLLSAAAWQKLISACQPPSPD